VALGGEARQMDAAMANDLLYFNVAGFGFDVDVLHYVEIYKKRMKNGSLAYLRGLIAAIANLQSRRTKITWPGGSMEEDVLIIAAGNGTHFGGGMMVTPKADPFDGQLDICVMHGVKKRDALTLLPKFFKGNHLGTKFVTYFKHDRTHGGMRALFASGRGRRCDPRNARDLPHHPQSALGDRAAVRAAGARDTESLLYSARVG
jgi:diacylglycerol kinase family enzyme